MAPPPANTKTVYETLLAKHVVPTLEAMYGIVVGANAAPVAPDGSTIARHFAAYLATSGVRCWLFKFPDRETQEDVFVLITKPQKSSTISGFKALRLRPWMKDIPELTKQFALAYRNPDTNAITRGLKLIPWSAQAGSPEVFKQAFTQAGELSAHLDVSLPIVNELSEPNLEAFDLFAPQAAMTPAAPSGPLH